jgi:hypothetical protein
VAEHASEDYPFQEHHLKPCLGMNKNYSERHLETDSAPSLDVVRDAKINVELYMMDPHRDPATYLQHHGANGVSVDTACKE